MPGSQSDRLQMRKDPEDKDCWMFRLYIAGEAPNSCLALDNLESLLKESLPDKYQLEVVDILADPLRAIQDGILVTPTLVRVSPGPVFQLAGNLQDHDLALRSLGIL